MGRALSSVHILEAGLAVGLRTSLGLTSCNISRSGTLDGDICS